MGNRTISITTGTIFKTLILLAGAWLLYEIRDILLIVLTSIVIASAVEPGVTALMRYRFSRIGAVIFIYAGLLSICFTILFLLLPSLLEDVAVFIASLPTYINAVVHTGVLDQYTRIFGVPAISSMSTGDILNAVRSIFSPGTVGNVVGAAGGFFSGLLSTVLIIVFSFYFAVLDTSVDDFLQIIVPKRHQRYMLGLWRRSQHKIGLWMQGQLLLGLIVGILVYLGLLFLGVEHALVLALIAGVFELIPVFGPTLSAIPAVTVAVVGNGVPTGIATAAVFVIVQQLENHVIYPWVVNRVVGVPPLLVILALLVGAHIAGFLGIILSVPCAAILREFVSDYQRGHVPFLKDGGVDESTT